MTDLFTQFDTRLDQAIDEVALELASGSLTKMTLFSVMKRLHGSGSAEGRWTQRDAYDLLEAGVTRHLLKSPCPVHLDDITALSLLVEELQPIPSEVKTRSGFSSSPRLPISRHSRPSSRSPGQTTSCWSRVRDTGRLWPACRRSGNCTSMNLIPNAVRSSLCFSGMPSLPGSTVRCWHPLWIPRCAPA